MQLKFDPTDKWHIHKLESVQEYETIFEDFEITGFLTLTRRPDLIEINNKHTKQLVNFVITSQKLDKEK